MSAADLPNSPPPRRGRGATPRATSAVLAGAGYQAVEPTYRVRDLPGDHGFEVRFRRANPFQRYALKFRFRPLKRFSQEQVRLACGLLCRVFCRLGGFRVADDLLVRVYCELLDEYEPREVAAAIDAKARSLAPDERLSRRDKVVFHSSPLSFAGRVEYWLQRSPEGQVCADRRAQAAADLAYEQRERERAERIRNAGVNPAEPRSQSDSSVEPGNARSQADSVQPSGGAGTADRQSQSDGVEPAQSQSDGVEPANGRSAGRASFVPPRFWRDLPEPLRRAALDATRSVAQRLATPSQPADEIHLRLAVSHAKRHMIFATAQFGRQAEENAFRIRAAQRRGGEPEGIRPASGPGAAP